MLQVAADLLERGDTARVSRHLTQELGMCCGGAMTVFLECVESAPRLYVFGAGYIAKPLAAIAAFFVLALSTQLIVGSQSYWQVSPVVAAPWDVGSNASMATFYPYVPDLAMAQVMFPAGLTVALLAALALPRGSGGRRLRAAAAAVTAAGLAAAGTAVTDTALGPLLSEVAGLPGAPARVSQAAAVYRQGTGNGVSIGLAGPAISGRPPVFRLLLPVQLAGPALTASELAAQIRSDAGLGIASSIVGAGRHPSPAQQAVLAVLARASGLPQPSAPPRSTPSGSRRRAALSPPAPEPAPGSPAYAAAQRFAALTPAARRTWLAAHLPALRAGRITLAQLP